MFRWFTRDRGHTTRYGCRVNRIGHDDTPRFGARGIGVREIRARMYT